MEGGNFCVLIHREDSRNKAERYGIYKLAGNIFWFVLVYLLVMNIIGLSVMGIDKLKAKRHTWRIPEKTLFLISIFGGSAGTWAGMHLFRHKTKHWYFVFGMPAILIVHIVIAVVVFNQWFR